MSEYSKECIFCKAKIRMSDQKEGKWLPYNPDGSQHECKAKTGNGNNDKTSKSVLNKGNEDLSLDLIIFLKKLSSIGIDVRLDVLRNAINGDSK